MNDIKSIAFALDPNNVPTFLLDWEVTKLCNLDCSYCGITGHDNTTKHPPMAECLTAINFMYEYVDLYMQHKKPSQRKVVLNVYGGESLFHPNIVEILNAVRDKYAVYQDRWNLAVTCTTNAVIGKTQWAKIVPLIDEFTVSYHTENLPKQKQQYLDNILYLKEQGKRFKCIIMMHNNPVLFADAESVIEFCKANGLRYLSKPLDNSEPEWAYTAEQFAKVNNKEQIIQFVDRKVNSIDVGRSCCGGRLLSLNNNLKSRETFVERQGFKGWSCGVNWFFLYIQQLDGAVYTNKDCKTSTSGRVEPLGYLSDSEAIIQTLKSQLDNNMPIIKCVKPICRWGGWAPKAKIELEFLELIKRNVPIDMFQKTC
jgi:MoaA/NifB/PqqE/SkfB family radical SAM enzyme